jgi:hypothetical protein
MAVLPREMATEVVRSDGLREVFSSTELPDELSSWLLLRRMRGKRVSYDLDVLERQRRVADLS